MIGEEDEIIQEALASKDSECYNAKVMEIDLIKQKIMPTLRQSGVKRAGLFGSTVKKNKIPADIDLVVELDNKLSLLGFINLKRTLEEILGKKVDLVEYSTLKSALKNNILSEQVNILD